MPEKIFFVGAILLAGLCAIGPAAQARMHRINLMFVSHPLGDRQRVGSPYGVVKGHHAAMPEKGTAYAGVEAKYEGLSGGRAYATGMSVGISRASHRNVFRDCMIQNGAWE
ncbi:hypothetical protein JCM25156A_25380 [Komagataeibacter kakiaceti JCM 25156]|uniref:hypothetical protein n=1 Tax=Komagataeibacter kakiaceti TaxID=943261 RepID=UPI0004704AAA|nr:hypothetical protein [Komagataeibacter kakiaceti]